MVGRLAVTVQSLYGDCGTRGRYLGHWNLITSHRILWDIITYTCPRYLLLVPKSSYTEGAVNQISTDKMDKTGIHHSSLSLSLWRLLSFTWPENACWNHISDYKIMPKLYLLHADSSHHNIILTFYLISNAHLQHWMTEQDFWYQSTATGASDLVILHLRTLVPEAGISGRKKQLHPTEFGRIQLFVPAWDIFFWLQSPHFVGHFTDTLSNITKRWHLWLLWSFHIGTSGSDKKSTSAPNHIM